MLRAMLHLLLEVTLIYRPLNDHVTKRISLSFLTKGLNAPKQNLAPQHTKCNPKKHSYNDIFSISAQPDVGECHDRKQRNWNQRQHHHDEKVSLTIFSMKISSMIIWNMIWQAHFWTLLLLYEIWMAVMMLMDTSILFRLNGRVHSNWQNIQITQICPLPFQKQKSKSVEVEDAIFKKVVNCPWVLPPALPQGVNPLPSPWSRSCLPTCSPTAPARRCCMTSAPPSSF